MKQAATGKASATQASGRGTPARGKPASVGKDAPAKPARIPRRRTAGPEVAKQHFLEALQAKQERVRQGPSYPPANAFTGRVEDESMHAPVISDAGAAPVDQPAPSPEATYVTNLLRARGNQGMRKQR